MNRRAEILQELVRYEKPSAPLVRELRCYGWEWDGEPLLVIRRDDLLRIIDRFLVGAIDATGLQEWAANLEVREDVAFDERENELLDGIFFRLATPSINEALTQQSVQRMKDELLQTHG